MKEINLHDYENSKIQKSFIEHKPKTILEKLQETFDKGLIDEDTFEKAKKDLSKLKQETITDKNGHQKKVWVLREEHHPVELKHNSFKQNETLI